MEDPGLIPKRASREVHCDTAGKISREFLGEIPKVLSGEIFGILDKIMDSLTKLRHFRRISWKILKKIPEIFPKKLIENKKIL